LVGLAWPWRWSRSREVNVAFCKCSFLYGLTVFKMRICRSRRSKPALSLLKYCLGQLRSSSLHVCAKQLTNARQKELNPGTQTGHLGDNGCEAAIPDFIPTGTAFGQGSMPRAICRFF